jgi:hypothetical protein
MPLAREIRRRIIASRRLQEKRNAAAEAEEYARQARLPAGRKMLEDWAPENKSLARPARTEEVITDPDPAPLPEPEAVDALQGVPFASEKAQELAELAGLTGASFYGMIPSGRTGFTAADVRDIDAARSSTG